jgi:hypothetical protein
MRNAAKLTVIAILIIAAAPSFADLQNVVVGGSIRLRGNYFAYDKLADTHINSNASVEQRTRLNVRADFTDSVSAFIEFDDYETWGGGDAASDFRSNYLTGIDNRAATGDDVEVYQAYIDAKELWGTGLNARIGRQELKFGSGWLVGNNDAAPYFKGLSFDAALLSYATDQFSVAAVGGKLQENSPLQEDGDISLYGVYGSYLGIENVTLDAYWLFIRNAADFQGSLDAHAFGLRGAGTIGAFDFEAEGAYEYLRWDGSNAVLANGDDNSDAFAGNLVLGYTFDAGYTPRVYVGAAYFGGDDEDLAFNRLFSDWKYSLILDTEANLSNIWLVHGGVSVNPTETLKLTASAGYIQTIEERAISAWKNSDKPLGLEVGIRADYSYSKDLTFAAGYSHLFTFDGLKDGNFVPNNGNALAFADDVNYVFAEAKLSF